MSVGVNVSRILIGLIGANIQKSLSPLLHEDALAAAGLQGFYHLMDLDRLPGRQIGDLLAAARTAGFRGLNITFPCKEAVMPLLDAIAPDARGIGAVNTVTIGDDGRTTGYNTDSIGFRRSVEESLGRAAIDGKIIVLVGAGGAGRAVAFALGALGAAEILIHDRDAARSAKLAADLAASAFAGRCRAIDAVVPALAGADGIVNATNVGMHGFPGVPVPLDAIEARHVVADVIYTPLETALIKGARAKGARVLTGGGMCVHQAAEGFRLFTSRAPDVARMARVFAAAVTARDAALAAEIGAARSG